MTHNQNNNSVSTGSSLLTYFVYLGVVAGGVFISHCLNGTWGIM